MKASEIRKLSAKELDAKLLELRMSFSNCASSRLLTSSTTRCESVPSRRT